ncbi:UDP-N-acetylenolpyruvoylglucosamine reductase [Ignatzschineria ureiclastica]|uniref:UDP-N-acetylenolpyruvoylglucosamine reductase n=1 Tax=Ignatzschineria ureiclastica TaxID=472582 RepID=A0A2U2AFX1_9GAMM|nr:UDP-N-acetylmuramate dehydrogenase [Ignatzschineria ureiclastica]PWD81564.1 UDP-N-acetylenolpyruvoylglucosamine reductase [Ignatzschineria ureiclastica]GHA01684.1 UDP-N-acetylenolpyruvoylglucosamine reductase [Ignatzschineria ureiclastica]
MRITQKQNLKAFNTLGVDVSADYFAIIDNLTDRSKLRSLTSPILFLGGGSNILFTQDYSGTVVYNQLRGIEVLHQEQDSVFVRAMGGEVWHNFVVQMHRQGFYGLEYLALIPGTVGASPVQNIGAYGFEVKDFIESVEAFDCQKNCCVTFTKEACNFGYRDSFFKQNPGRFFITAVTFKLSTLPVINLSYHVLQRYLNEQGVESDQINATDILSAVIAIRSSKLPDPKVLGNAGSFFKNPVISLEKWYSLQQAYPQLVHYLQEDPNKVKLAAGQLIDIAGFKGVREGNVGMHKDQALILVNYGNAKGEELRQFSEKVQKKILSQFDIMLEAEPLIL